MCAGLAVSRPLVKIAAVARKHIMLRFRLFDCRKSVYIWRVGSVWCPTSIPCRGSATCLQGGAAIEAGKLVPSAEPGLGLEVNQAGSVFQGK